MSGKYGSASWSVFTVDGYDFLPQKPKGLTYKIGALQEDTLGLGDSTEEMTPTGLLKLEVSQNGAFFDDATNGAHALLAPVANQQVSRLLGAANGGNTIGKPFIGGSGVYGHEYDVIGSVAQLTKANVTYHVAGKIDLGLILNQSVAKTADWNTKTDGNQLDYTLDAAQRVIPIASATKANPCVVTTSVPHGLTSLQIVLISGNSLSGPAINSALAVTVLSTTTFSVAVNTAGSSGAGTGGSFVLGSNVAGGAGYLFVPEFSGFTGFVGKIKHSTDDSSYSDLITFTNVTAAKSAERVTVASTVNRYLAFDGDVTGSGSLKAFVGFARYLS